jgi:hypothetical protein
MIGISVGLTPTGGLSALMRQDALGGVLLLGFAGNLYAVVEP